MSKTVFDGIARGLKDAVADARGRRGAARRHVVRVPADVDVKAIRARLGLTQRQFATKFGFSVATLQNWERGHRRPEAAARLLLKVIAHEPEAVHRALAA